MLYVKVLLTRHGLKKIKSSYFREVKKLRDYKIENPTVKYIYIYISSSHSKILSKIAHIYAVLLLSPQSCSSKQFRLCGTYLRLFIQIYENYNMFVTITSSALISSVPEDLVEVVKVNNVIFHLQRRHG